MATATTNFDPSVRDGFRESIKNALHNAIDAGDYDLVSALTEFGKRVDNLKPARGGANGVTSGIEQGADVEPVNNGPADGEAV
jgi:hypothetical protein